MEFGKKYRVGNFYMIKVTKTLPKKELATIREWIPEELRKNLSRHGMPYIKVGTVTGSWGVEFGPLERMFSALDGASKEELADKETISMLSNLFSGMYVDTSMLGDKEYNTAKSEALQSLTKRLAKAKREETEEEKAEDDSILEEMKRDAENAETILKMASRLEKEEGA